MNLSHPYVKKQIKLKPKEEEKLTTRKFANNGRK
jgi:hypothetical protein